MHKAARLVILPQDSRRGCLPGSQHVLVDGWDARFAARCNERWGAPVERAGCCLAHTAGGRGGSAKCDRPAAGPRPTRSRFSIAKAKSREQNQGSSPDIPLITATKKQIPPAGNGGAVGGPSAGDAWSYPRTIEEKSTTRQQVLTSVRARACSNVRVQLLDQCLTCTSLLLLASVVAPPW